MSAANRRYVHVVYCDDIRTEVGNKRSFMGVYGPSLFVPDIPCDLARLCIWITVSTPSNKPFSSLAFRVLDGSDVLAEATIPSERLAEAATSAPPHGDPDSQTFINYEAHVVLSPFKVDTAKTIRVRVIAEDGEYRGTALRIEKGQKEPVATH